MLMENVLEIELYDISGGSLEPTYGYPHPQSNRKLVLCESVYVL